MKKDGAAGRSHHHEEYAVAKIVSPQAPTERSAAYLSLATSVVAGPPQPPISKALRFTGQPRVHPAWVANKLQRLDELLRREPQRAKAEILKHLEGDLEIVPQPSLTGERRAEIRGRAKSDSLLSAQEAVCLQVAAGARFEPATCRYVLAAPSRQKTTTP